MSAFKEFLSAEFPSAQIEELSGSNNHVYLVRTAGGPLIAKHVIDTDIPLAYLAETNARLGDHLPVQRILHVWETARNDPFDAIFAEYVEGTDLAAVLSDHDTSRTVPDLAAYFVSFVLACREIPPMHDSFGMYKQHVPTFGSHTDYVVHYGNRYWSRVRHFYVGTPICSAVDAWLAGGFEAASERRRVPHVVVPIDANLKNFVLTADGQIVVLNLPIAAVSTPAHALAALSTHLRNRDLHQQFLDEAARLASAGDEEMVPHFELWLLLGILSFYAVRQPDRQDEWRDWGAPVPLSADFTELAGQLLPGAR